MTLKRYTRYSDEELLLFLQKDKPLIAFGKFLVAAPCGKGYVWKGGIWYVKSSNSVGPRKERYIGTGRTIKAAISRAMDSKYQSKQRRKYD